MAKILLQQDDAAPDSLEMFNKKFEQLMLITPDKFKAAAKYTSVDDGYSHYYQIGVYTLEIHADDPYWLLRMYTFTKNDT